MPRAEECPCSSALEPVVRPGNPAPGGTTLSLLSAGCDLPPSVSLENQAPWRGPLDQLLLEIPCLLACS